MSPFLNDLIWSVVILGFLGVCFLGVHALGRRRELKPELSRKLVHMTMAVAVLPFPWVFRIWLTVPVIGLLATAGLLAVRLLAPKGEKDIGGVLYRVGRIRSVGELVYPAAVVTAYLLAPSPAFFMIPILVLGFADSLAALVGTEYARKQLAADRESPKSMEGAVAFFAASFICVVSPLLLFPEIEGPVILLVTILIAAMATLLELVCSFGLDNFLIPFFISVFLSRLSALSFAALLTSFFLLVIYLAIAWAVLRRRHITPLGIVEALLVLYLTTLIGGLWWMAAPLILAFTYTLFPRLTEQERARPLNYHDIESNLIPGLGILIFGLIRGQSPLAFWVYSTYYACMTAKNHALRIYNFFPENRQTHYRAAALVRGCLLQLLPAALLFYGAYGAFPPLPYFFAAGAAVALEILVSDKAVRSFDFPIISIRLGWISSLSSAALAGAVALISLLGI